MEQISQNCGEWLPGQVQEIFRSTFGTSLIIADVKRNHISSGANPDSCAGIGGRGDLARFCVQGERRTDLSHGAGYRVQFLHNNSKYAAMNSQHRQHIQTGYFQNARHARDTSAMPSFASWPRTSSVISSFQSAAVIGVAPDAQNLACLDLRGTRDDLFPVEPRYSARGTADADEFRFLYDAEGRRIYPRVNMHSIPVENRDRPKSREDNHAERVHMATRGCEGALQRKQKVVKSEGDKIIRKWVQELVRFYPSGERGYDILEVKSLKREEIDRLYWEEVEELFAECLELGRDSSADDEQEVEVFPAEEEEEEEEEAEEDEEEP